MAATFGFRLLTPERTVMEGDAEQVILRTDGGDIAFLAGHVQLIGVVEPAVLRALRSDGTELQAAVHGGFVEVRGGDLSVVATVAETSGEIDVPRAERARAAAEERLAQGEDTDAERALASANARLALAGQARG